ncbi:MAG: hypothetical protein LUB59_05640 [Candidatus Gastranaerophilales bacterium]|nr:hypothetical protein [Candidatus Gastranaerophilales bacterium]
MSIITGTPKLINTGMQKAAGRFAPTQGNITRALNRIAINETKSRAMHYTYSKAVPEDLKRLTSKSIEDSYKRVSWTNPKDGKVYHILEEGREKDKVQVRILDKDGAFVKNAELTPKTIVIFDNFFSPKGLTHGEIMETFVKRFNPFAKVERLEHKKNIFEILRYRGRLPMELEEKRFSELADKMDRGKKVDYISISEVNLVDAEDVTGKPGYIQKQYVAKSGSIKSIKPLFERIMSKGTRILDAAGNENNFAKEVVNDRLAIEGVEGAGSLRKGKIAHDSCSRNSVFTQHYERRDYFPRLTKGDNGEIIGVNLTGLEGTDLPLNWKTKKLNTRLGGTSYAAPVRAAKLALNDMLEGIL